MVNKQPAKIGNKDPDKTTGLYKIAAKIMKKVKTGNSYKSQLYQAQYPVRLRLCSDCTVYVAFDIFYRIILMS